jgi:multicomponent Na+:H+ antiporter subunit D
MDIVVVLPLLIPFFTAIACLLLWNFYTAQRIVALFGGVALLVTAIILLFTVAQDGIQVMQASDWPAPFGISLVADLFSAIMVLMAGIMAVVVLVYSQVTMDERRASFGYYALIHFLLVGVCGAFLTGDIFNLYVWYEVMLISSFVLLVLGGERAQLEGGIKYVTLNLMASALFLAAVGILYGTVGSLNMADIAQHLHTVSGASLAPVLAILFMIAFGIKSALFPLFFWLPAAYHTPPIAVTVIFSGLLTKVGIYSLIRVFTLIFTQHVGLTHTILLVLAALTMITGVLGAVAQYDIRRLLAFHIISQIGYLLMGLGLFSPLAIAGSIFFMVHVILAKSALFLVGGVLHSLGNTYDLKKMGGFYRTSPVMSVLFLLPALSLAGIPPLSGFWAKFALVWAGLELQQYWVVAAALGVSILTLFSMTKIWNEAFLKEQTDARLREAVPSLNVLPFMRQLPMLTPIVVIALLMVVIGVLAEPIFALSLQAAEQLIDPTEYIRAVLGEPT